MRRVIFIMLLASVLLFTACSYITDFVVVNSSDQPIEVWYKIKSFPGPFVPPVTPAILTTDQLRVGDEQWQELSAAQYRLDPDKRIIVVHLMPNKALLIERVHRGGMQINDAEEAESFAIEEITIVGAYGEKKLQGEKARKSFLAESNKLFTLTYP